MALLFHKEIVILIWALFDAYLGKIGYVANSPYTVLGESYSAEKLYDKMSEEASGKVKFILNKGVICELVE